MEKSRLTLTEAEWQVMECLWQSAPASGREVCETMEKARGWSRSTTLTLIRRMEAKSAVGEVEGAGRKAFIPLISRDEAAINETENLLARIYHGSMGLMLSSFTRKQRLSKSEIDEMYALLSELEAQSGKEGDEDA